MGEHYCEYHQSTKKGTPLCFERVPHIFLHNWKKKGISNAHRSTRTPRRRATPRRSGRAMISAVACSSSKSRLLGRRRRRRPKSRKTCRRFYYICANIASTAYRCSRPPFEYYYNAFDLILFYCVWGTCSRQLLRSPKKSVTWSSSLSSLSSSSSSQNVLSKWLLLLVFDFL